MTRIIAMTLIVMSTLQGGQGLVVNQNALGVSTKAATASYLEAIAVQRLSAMTAKRRVRLVIVDTGVNVGTLPNVIVNKTLAKSFADDDPFRDPYQDPYGHGTKVFGEAYQIISMNPTVEVELVSLKVATKCASGTCVSNDVMVQALTEIASWTDKVPTVVNISLQNGPVLSEVYRLMSQKSGVLYVLIAGNNNTAPATFPGWYAQELSNAICIGSVELDGKKSFYSNYGDRVHGGGYGTLINGWYGTSFAAPQYAGVAINLWSAFEELTPQLIKKLLMAGKFDSLLVGVFGNPTTLCGDCSLDAYGRLKTIRPDRSGIEVAIGSNLTFNVMDNSWFTNFLAGDALYVQYTDANGKVLSLQPVYMDQTGKVSTPLSLWAGVGDYKLRLVVAGLVLDGEMSLSVLPPTAVVHAANGTPVTPDSPAKVGETLRVTFASTSAAAPAVGAAYLAVQVGEEQAWWQIAAGAFGFSQYPGYRTLEIRVAGKNDPLPSISGQTTLFILADGVCVGTPAIWLAKSSLNSTE